MDNIEAKDEMQILQGAPIKVVIFGNEIEVKKMNITNQQKAIGLIQGLSENRANKSAMEFSFQLMSGIVEIATGLSPDEISEKSDMVEIAVAFRAIWKQNRFDFLLKTIAELGNDLTGEIPATK